MKITQREAAILSKIGSIMGTLQISIPDLARITGLKEMTLRRRIKTPSEFRQYELWAIEDAARRRGWKE